jgi:alpha,alpha-trehalose-phosphate synthase [UDP-forming]
MVSNRLPMTFVKGDQQDCHVEMSAGGLATALRAVAGQRTVRWIGWAGADYDPDVRDIIASSVALNCDLIPLLLSEADRRDFYCGFCNEIIWPLFHGLPPTSSFEPAYWKRYLEVNARYADLICREASSDDFVWIHDYHLMLQGKLLSFRRNRDQLAFFLHIPFPPAYVLAKLPWKVEILDSLLSFGTVGFQTAQDRQNFLACARTYFPDVQIKSTTSGISVLRGQYRTVVRHCPIGIDFEEFARLATQPQVTAEAEQIRRDANVRRLMLGIDRLDYTKGIPQRLEAFRDVLTRYVGLRQEISLVQVVVPSREEISRYQELKNQVEGLVSTINREFGTASWVPIRYQYGHLSREQLVAHYRAADIALVTPLKDGMNLVAKEFCASRVDETGILILSKFAGAATQLGTGAYLVDPRHPSSLASALYDAVDPDEGDVRRRMRRMRRNIKANDIQWWYDEMLRATSTAERELTEKKPSAKRGWPDSWQLQISQLSAAANGKIP